MFSNLKKVFRGAK